MQFLSVVCSARVWTIHAFIALAEQGCSHSHTVAAHFKELQRKLQEVLSEPFEVRLVREIGAEIGRYDRLLIHCHFHAEGFSTGSFNIAEIAALLPQTATTI